MLPYPLIRPLVFALNPEHAHHVTMHSLQAMHRLCLLKPLLPSVPSVPTKLLGNTLANPVGLAAGLDKNGSHIDALAAMGFGFIEIGTITPKAQPGNAKPRLFRLPQAGAIINRMGFNNHGVAAMRTNIERSNYRGVLGINIGKNASTPVENAADDYLECMQQLYAYASYITVNVSSPNTQGLRGLQTSTALVQLLSAIKNKQSQLASQHGKKVQLVLKIAPDLSLDEIDFIAEQLVAFEMEGLIASNTTLDKSAVAHLANGAQQGGLSGEPVRGKSNACLAAFAERLGDKVELIGVGGISQGAHAAEKIQLGAKAVQIYSGLIYTGPSLVADCATAIAAMQPHKL